MYQNIKVKEIMSTDLVTLKPNETLDKVQQIFKEHSFHHLPVVDESTKVIGMISKSDMNMLCDSMTYFQNKSAEHQNNRLFKSLLAKEVMKKEVMTLHYNDDLAEAAKLFEKNLFHALPIVDETNNLVGILSTYDLINYVFNPSVNVPFS